MHQERLEVAVQEGAAVVEFDSFSIDEEPLQALQSTTASPYHRQSAHDDDYHALP